MKNTLSKIWNVIFNALIASVLVLCLFMMVKYFYFKEPKTIELGSLSDWFSTLANLATACAAVYAAIKAKDFVSSKIHSDAYDLSKKIVVFQMHELIMSLSPVSSTCVDVRDNINDTNKMLTHPLDQSLKILLDQLDKTLLVMKEIEANLRVLRKLGFTMNKEPKFYFEEYFEQIRFFLKNGKDISSDIFSTINDRTSIQKKVELNNKITKLIECHAKCALSHTNFYYFQDGFFNYFSTIKK